MTREQLLNGQKDEINVFLETLTDRDSQNFRIIMVKLVEKNGVCLN